MDESGKYEISGSEIRQYNDAELWNNFFKQSFDVFCIIDIDGNIIKSNPAFQKLLEYTEEEVGQRTVVDFVHPEDVEHSFEALETVRALGNLSDFGNRLISKSGKIIWLSWTLSYHPEKQFVYATGRNLTEIKEFEKLARNSVKRLNDIIEGITDGFFTLDNEWRIVSCNKSAVTAVGMTREDVIGKVLWDLFPGADQLLFYKEYKRSVTERVPVHFEEHYKDLNTWFEITAYPIEDGLTVFSRNITEKKQQELLNELEREVLEFNAVSSNTLADTIDHLIVGLEKIFPDMKGSVMLYEEETKTMRVLSAPSIPEAYSRAVDGLPIGPSVGSCGSAMYSRNITIVSDIATDQLWEDYREVATTHGLLACWSVPLIGSVNQVLGSFGMYYHQKRKPEQSELNFIGRVANLVRIIVENKKAEEIIHFSNTRYDLITSATNDMIWDWDIAKDEVYRSPHGLIKVFGMADNSPIRHPNEWLKRIHPEDIRKLQELIDKILQPHGPRTFDFEYRFLTDDGTYNFVYDRGNVIRDDNGVPTRLIGAAQNINERKRFEQQLLEQEVNKQRLIAKATIEGQERERIEIGKELHDNINQVLTTSKLLLDLSLADPSQSQAMIQKSKENILHAINEIRRISKNLVPPSIGDLGLKTAVVELIETLSLTTGIKMSFKTSGKVEQIPESQKLSVFRIIQEQLNNVIRHADASSVSIVLKLRDKKISLQITDNGKGFDITDTRRGVGLTNILNRSEIFGGKLNLDTSPGKGCALSVSMPLQDESAPGG